MILRREFHLTHEDLAFIAGTELAADLLKRRYVMPPNFGHQRTADWLRDNMLGLYHLTLTHVCFSTERDEEKFLRDGLLALETRS